MVAGFFIKASALLFYRRLLQRTDMRLLECLVNIGLGLVLANCLSCFIIGIFLCTPPSAAWRSLRPGYTTPFRCMDRVTVELYGGMFSCFTDFYALLLPELIIRGLHITRTQKAVVWAVLGCNSMYVVTHSSV